MALADEPAAAHANRVVLDIFDVGGVPLLKATALGIEDSALGRRYLSVHIYERQTGCRGPDTRWRELAAEWLARLGSVWIFPHSGAMTTIRFMLVDEGFASMVKGTVTIDPHFLDAVQRALSCVSPR